MQTELVSSSIFRAYDIRGEAGKTLTEESIFLIGKAIGSLIREQGENELTVARDGRLSGPLLMKALCAGLLSVGCDVINIGMVPTPLLYYATHIFAQHSGVMLTGSHNPSNYNGLKIVIKKKTLAEDEIKSLYDRIMKQDFQSGHGKEQSCEIIAHYIDHLVQNIHMHRPMHIVVDAGNGVTSHIAPILYEKLGCNVHPLFCEIDGAFPNHHPDPSDPKNLQALIDMVRETDADIGFSFDGDGDRLGVVTNQGEVINPDRLLMLFAQALLREHPRAKIVYDVKCTDHLDKHIRSLNGEPIMWKTGHSLIKTKLAESQAKLGGEMSGHFFFKDRWYGFDDALYAGARLLEILSQYQEDCHTIFAAMPNSINTPELKISVEDDEKFALMEKLIAHAHFTEAKEVMTIDGLRVNFGDGFGLIRPSNTTPFLILRFEAMNEVILTKIQNIFRDWILSVKPDLVLPF